jgi:hypothetical protein
MSLSDLIRAVMSRIGLRCCGNLLLIVHSICIHRRETFVGFPREGRKEGGEGRKNIKNMCFRVSP